MRRLCMLLLITPALWCAPTVADDARQVIARRCVACHSGAAKQAGLDLTSSLAAAVPARMLGRVTRGQMPPGKPLPEVEVETLRRWMAAGAPAWAAIAPQRAGLDWWAFQPLRTPRTGESIDGFVREKLAAKGWPVAPAADRRTLIRRVTFGLTGLPPAPVEISAFVADARPDAYARLVDGLLASPRYGEHWARHWLDVVRYAESEGFERDWLRDHAWPYRDYVIRSFNDDKPYAQFVREQLAGDVLTPGTREGLIATGLLTLGPFDAVGFTSAVAQERDQVRADQMEEMVGVVAQTFLGLTVNCARCHDHKFDPIPQRDYYRLKAVFDGVFPSTYGSELKADGRLVLTPAEAAAHQAQLSEIRQRIAGEEAALASFDRAGRPPLPRHESLAAMWTFDSDARDEVGRLHAPALAENAIFLEGRLAPAPGQDAVTVTSVPLTFDLSEKTLEAWVYVRKPAEKNTTVLQIRNRNAFRGSAVDGIQLAGGKRRQWRNTSTVDFRTEDVDGPPDDSPAGARVHVAITYAASGEIRLYRNGQPYGKPYTPDKGTAHGLLQTYGRGDAIVEMTSANGLELEQARIFAKTFSAADVALLYQAGVANFTPPATVEREQMVVRIATARLELKAVESAPAKAFAAVSRQPLPTQLLIRGDVTKPGDVMTPAAVSCVKGLPGELDLPADAPEAERRLRLASWITHPANPLYARVMVNRIWHYHFGAGLVESPNDFGFNGGLPSHPELLDWLAAEFLRTKGSVKHIQRLIAMSDTYRQSSRLHSEAAARDASARLLWRFPPQRLPAEAVRDAMLAASGALNEAMYGPSFRPFQIIKNSGSYHSYDPVDSADPALQRRTIYRMNINSGGNPMLDALDCPLPSMKTPKRSSTTTALQALSLMNNPFADRMAKALAARVEKERATPAARVAYAYELTLGRLPREDEAASVIALVDEHGLATLCWSLFNMSEFVYVH